MASVVLMLNSHSLALSRPLEPAFYVDSGAGDLQNHMMQSWLKPDFVTNKSTYSTLKGRRRRNPILLNVNSHHTERKFGFNLQQLKIESFFGCFNKVNSKFSDRVQGVTCPKEVVSTTLILLRDVSIHHIL
jgi:hypothetical protein